MLPTDHYRGQSSVGKTGATMVKHLMRPVTACAVI
ncbi:hypothetical protein ABIC09_006644 [Bradyrhizobium sp. S3.12.5]